MSDPLVPLSSQPNYEAPVHLAEQPSTTRIELAVIQSPTSSHPPDDQTTILPVGQTGPQRPALPTSITSDNCISTQQDTLTEHQRWSPSPTGKVDRVPAPPTSQDTQRGIQRQRQTAESLQMAAALAQHKEQANSDMRTARYGCSGNKKTVDHWDLAAFLLSMLALIVAIVVIHPKLHWAWRLGFQNQLVNIGVMLNLMNFCMMRVLPAILILLERRW